MKKKPFYKSRKFVILALDAVAALATLWVAQLLPEESAALALQTLAVLQPVVFAVVIGIAVEDSAALKAGSHPAQVSDGD